MQSKHFIFMLVLLAAGCRDNASSTAAVPATDVTVQTLHTESIHLNSELTGRVTAALVSEVRPQVDGIIQKRRFTEGSEVKVGQVLYQIDPATYQAAYDEAAAALKNAQASVHSSRLKAERYARLLKSEGVSQQDADDAQSTYEAAIANVAEKQAALNTARINLNYTQIKAPIAGRIGISSVTPGALVIASQTTALATIRQLDPIYVDLTQSSRQRLALQAMQKADDVPVTLMLENGTTYPYTGTLRLAEVVVDESTGSVTLRAEFPNPQHLLLPGMYARASVVQGEDPKAILVPQQGITRDAKGNAVALVVNDQQKVEQRTVVTEQAIGNRWRVTEGLTQGDRVIIEGTDKVSVGQFVNPVDVSATTTDTADNAIVTVQTPADTTEAK
ncbi:efflux RND transporter periplasmic adaptor subunit [Pectobacterium zantedeschiae]|uniref:Efflux RND transporter periplasmic adaptor subunit n=1 Tax=Pectobacterium zantedeschiae TaxID=2034769 RepID=A0A9X8P5V8_9GAMM|nr:efflux RND transporter periplasmic adaptor subunit [Pectobacterium zantedeschiae]RYC38277.1 efflux transporter periplasmic adaptor subunit [Pectobacterium zantedeschiae]RYC44922.1 efflux RND transporter periplasmic adaptor subunit [Pectobacterium zantedeschiae]